MTILDSEKDPNPPVNKDCHFIDSSILVGIRLQDATRS
jgi:hypothetical protein